MTYIGSNLRKPVEPCVNNGIHAFILPKKGTPSLPAEALSELVLSVVEVVEGRRWAYPIQVQPAIEVQPLIEAERGCAKLSHVEGEPR